MCGIVCVVDVSGVVCSTYRVICGDVVCLYVYVFQCVQAWIQGGGPRGHVPPCLDL